jgi:hypothetical protein
MSDHTRSASPFSAQVRAAFPASGVRVHPRRVRYSGTSDSNGQPFCSHCGKTPRDHDQHRSGSYCRLVCSNLDCPVDGTHFAANVGLCSACFQAAR